MPTSLPTSTSAPLLPGTRIQHLQLEFLVGQGSRGTVHAAQNLRSGERCAVKSFRGSGESRDAYLSELAAMTGVDSPHVIRLQDVLETRGAGECNHLVMEFAPHGSLRGLLESEGALSVNEATEYLRQILRGVSALHRSGWVHRDLKPENVLLFPGPVAKVADLEMCVPAHGEWDLRLSGGTPAYMAPEQQCDRPTPASDLYSIGVIFRELVCGTIQPETQVPAGAEGLVKWLTDREPSRRPSSCQEVLHALEAGRAEATLPVAAVRPERPPIRRDDVTWVTPTEIRQLEAAGAQTLIGLTRPGGESVGLCGGSGCDEQVTSEGARLLARLPAPVTAASRLPGGDTARRHAFACGQRVFAWDPLSQDYVRVLRATHRVVGMESTPSGGWVLLDRSNLSTHDAGGSLVWSTSVETFHGSPLHICADDGRTYVASGPARATLTLLDPDGTPSGAVFARGIIQCLGPADEESVAAVVVPFQRTGLHSTGLEVVWFRGDRELNRLSLSNRFNAAQLHQCADGSPFLTLADADGAFWLHRLRGHEPELLAPCMDARHEVFLPGSGMLGVLDAQRGVRFLRCFRLLAQPQSEVSHHAR